MNDDVLKIQLPRNVPGVSIAVVNESRVEWVQGLGFAVAGSSVPVTADTLFQACSISKAVTAVAVLRLVQEHRLNLDADVNRYMHSWQLPANDPASTEGVTIRQLLSHTAGVNLPWSAGYHPAQETPTLLEILTGEKPSIYPAIEVISKPGKEFRYSAGGYCILQQLLEDLTSESFPKLMQELVLRPLGMNRSTFEQPLPEGLWGSAAVGHRATGKAVAGSWRVYPEMAAAGLWTTASDLAKIGLDIQKAMSGAQGTLLSKETVMEMLSPQADAGDRGHAGLGVFFQGTGENALFGHPGDNEGYTARWISLAGAASGVVVMTNSDAGWPVLQDIIATIAGAYNWPIEAML